MTTQTTAKITTTAIHSLAVWHLDCQSTLHQIDDLDTADVYAGEMTPDEQETHESLTQQGWNVWAAQGTNAEQADALQQAVNAAAEQAS